MPLYNATPTYTQIPVEAGDIVQNTGRYMVLICAQVPASDADALEVPPGRGITITAASAISARWPSQYGSSVKIVRGM